MLNTHLLCSQPSSTRATTLCILSLLSQSLLSELISFTDNPRQRCKKEQKGYVATQNKTKNITA